MTNFPDYIYFHNILYAYITSIIIFFKQNKYVVQNLTNKYTKKSDTAVTLPVSQAQHSGV